MGRRWALGAALALLVAGCSSHYIPRRSARVSIVHNGGRLAYLRDGRAYPAGFLGGGLEDAVRGDREAEEYARTFHRRNVNGFWAMMIGFACAEGSFVYMALKADESPGYQPSDRAIATAAACVVTSVVGAGMTISAQPYQFDAVNRFNDAVDEKAAPRYTPPGARW